MQNKKFDYEKILSGVDGNLEVINHSQFRESFMCEYDRISNYGTRSVSLDCDNGFVRITASSNLPDATNGIYHGYKSLDTCVFSVENIFDNDYLCVRRKSSEVYSFDDKGDSVSYGESLDAYLKNEQVGKINFVYVNNCSTKNNPTFNIVEPNISLGYAINGTIPPDLSCYNGDIRCEVVGKTSGSGIARTSKYSCINGEFTQTSGLCAVSLENPYSLNTGEQNFAEIKNGNLVCINENYSSVDEAIADIQSRYDEKIKTRII